jgi:hydrocephalus-inducing protein
LNFGDVQTGCCRVITVQFFNPGKVPADWSLKKPMELTKNRDWNFFTAEPPEGILPPGEKLNVKFVFTPVKGRATPYSQIIPVKIANNPNPINFSASATGYTLKLQLDPPLVDCGPILPKFEGQKPNEVLLKLVNPSSYPIEVFNLDFDEAFNEQDQYLIEYPGYPEGKDTIFLDPLEPGQPFYPFIVKAVERKREM